MPPGAVQTSGTAQIIQTHLMPQAMIKQGIYNEIVVASVRFTLHFRFDVNLVIESFFSSF